MYYVSVTIVSEVLMLRCNQVKLTLVKRVETLESNNCDKVKVTNDNVK